MKKEFLNKYIISIIFFLIPFCCCLFYLYIYNPGILSYDSYNQINQIHTMTFNNWHPFFHTFIELICFKIWDNPMSVCIFQIVIISIIWTEICSYFYKKNEKIIYFIIPFSIILFLVIPLNAIYSITLWKDILFSYCLLYLTFLTYVIIREENINKYILIKIAMITSFIWKLRPNGKFSMLIFTIVFLVYLLKKKVNFKLIRYYFATLLIFLIFISSLNFIFKVENIEKDALSTKAAHYFVFCEKNNLLTNHEKDVINKLVDLKKGKKVYNVYYSDPIYTITNEKVFKKNKKEYITIILKKALKNPIKTIEYYVNSSSLVWKIIKNDKWIGDVYYTDINSVNNVEHFEAKNINKKRYTVLNKYVNSFKENKVARLFYSPALFMYVTIILVAIMLLKKNNKSILMTVVPNFLNIFIVSLSIPVQDVRYLYSNVLIGYFIIILFIEWSLNKYEKIKKINKKNRTN